MCTLRKSILQPHHNRRSISCLPCILMIIDFCHSFKDYNEILQFYGIWEYSCPVCGAKHRFHRHASYTRYLTLWDGDCLREECLQILRLQCGSCQTTHAILTMDMIPFCIYSIHAVLMLAAECLKEGGSVPKTEARTGVSFQLLYRFLLILQQYRERLLLFLRSQCLWTEQVHPSAGEIPAFLLIHPTPWPQAQYFREFLHPLFLRRRNTVSYPLVFGCRFPRQETPT